MWNLLDSDEYRLLFHCVINQSVKLLGVLVVQRPEMDGTSFEQCPCKLTRMSFLNSENCSQQSLSEDGLQQAAAAQGGKAAASSGISVWFNTLCKRQAIHQKAYPPYQAAQQPSIAGWEVVLWTYTGWGCCPPYWACDPGYPGGGAP